MTKTKRQSKHKNKVHSVDKLAESFDIDFKKILPLIPLPDGSVVYKNYQIKENKRGRWVIYSTHALDPHGEFNLKSCALIAAKALSRVQLEKYNEIKMLDTKYWSNYYTTQVCQHHIKKIKDFEHYLIMLNKLEHSSWIADNTKSEISSIFRSSFV